MLFLNGGILADSLGKDFASHNVPNQPSQGLIPPPGDQNDEKETSCCHEKNQRQKKKSLPVKLPIEFFFVHDGQIDSGHISGDASHKDQFPVLDPPGDDVGTLEPKKVV